MCTVGKPPCSACIEVAAVCSCCEAFHFQRQLSSYLHDSYASIIMCMHAVVMLWARVEQLLLGAEY